MRMSISLPQPTSHKSIPHQSPSTKFSAAYLFHPQGQEAQEITFPHDLDRFVHNPDRNFVNRSFYLTDDTRAACENNPNQGKIHVNQELRAHYMSQIQSDYTPIINQMKANLDIEEAKLSTKKDTAKMFKEYYGRNSEAYKNMKQQVDGLEANIKTIKSEIKRLQTESSDLLKAATAAHDKVKAAKKALTKDMYKLLKRIGIIENWEDGPHSETQEGAPPPGYQT
jgi:hypothetical protein